VSVILSLSLLASASEGEVGAIVSNENIFTEIYRAVTENSADILSLLSFAASVTVALFYKYALVPLIKGGLDKISSGVKDISGEHSAEYKKLAERQTALSERSAKIEEDLKQMCEGLKEISKRDSETTQKNLLTVMHAQVNMLYEIFQSSALPVYQKEAVGNMINEMRSELAKNENADK
jgi:hypothetical protein